MHRLRFTVSLLVLCLVSQAVAQTGVDPSASAGSWLIATVQMPGGEKKWGGYAEVQARSNGLFQQYFYNELKGGISYDLNGNFSLMLAGGHYATYTYQDLSDGPLNTEKRLWEQFSINQYLARLKFEHRYRVEQRWFTFRDGSTPFRNRIRYRLNTFIPLNNRTVTAKTVFVSVYDEIFLNPRGPAFERNRLYGGVGYQFDKHWVMQLGLVNQLDYTPATFGSSVFTPQTTRIKNNVVVGLTYRIPRRSTAESIPSQPD